MHFVAFNLMLVICFIIESIWMFIFLTILSYATIEVSDCDVRLLDLWIFAF